MASSEPVAAQDPHAEELAVCMHIMDAVKAHMQPYIDSKSVTHFDCSITHGEEGVPSGVAATWEHAPTWACPVKRTGYWWVDKTGRVYEAGRHTSKWNVLTDEK